MSWLRIHRMASWALPRELRRKHGAAMEALFVRELERAHRAGRMRRAIVAIAGVWDVLRRGAYERKRWRAGTHRPQRRQGNDRRKRPGGMIHDDLRYAFRSLRRDVAFTLAAVSILALGIGAATATFSAFRAIVLQDLPIADPDRIVSFSFESPTGDAIPLNPEEIDALRRRSRTLHEVAGVASFGAEAIPLAEGGRSLVLEMSRVTPNFFQLLGARPVLGRLLGREDGEEGAVPVTVISYRTWQREFGGDPEVVGRRLTHTGSQDSYSIIGVGPPGLDYPVGADYWIPAGPRFATSAMITLARLRANVTAEAARSELLAMARSVDRQRSRPRSPIAATVLPLSQAIVGDTKPILVAITAAVGLLLLIACANVGNLLLTRGTRRSHEVMVRRALGATSGRLARLFLVEGAFLGACGGALGLFLAVGVLRLLPALAPAGLPRTDMIGQAGVPVAIATAVTMVATLLFGVAPALGGARSDNGLALRGGARSHTATKRRRQVRRLLVAAQVALAVVLLFGAGLVVRSLERLSGLALGYDTDNVRIVELAFNRQGEGPAETFALLDGALERIRAVPGVSSATPIMSRPFMGETGVFQARPMLETQSESEAASNPQFPLEIGDQQLFRSLGIPILRGRGLLSTDREDAPKVAVVSQAVAQRLWPGEDPIGRRIGVVTYEPQWWTVVGVAGDTRFRHLRESTPTIYLHYRQLQILPGVWTVAVRTRGGAAAVVPALRQAAGDLDPRIHVWRIRTLRDHLAQGPLSQPRMSAALLSGFGLAALLLAAIGLYGVITLTVRERTHELGVRRAIGASTQRLRREVLGDALSIAALGLIVGLGGALTLSRLLVALLFEVSPADPLTMVCICATLLVVSVVAAYIPARRASRIDPVRALRHD